MTPLATPLAPAAPDAAVTRLVPSVTDLVRRAAGSDAVPLRSGAGEVRLSAALTFPDGIGRGAVVVEVFRYGSAVRVDLAIEHNRVFATRSGAPSDSRCYLNDYVASVTLPLDAAELPLEFVRKVIAGVSAARTAVDRERRRDTNGWLRIAITTAMPVWTPQRVA